MKFFVVFSVLLGAVYLVHSDTYTFIVEKTNVTVAESSAAIDTLRIIWNDFDTTDEARIKLFCELFNQSYNNTRGWNVVLGKDYTVYFSSLNTSFIDVKMTAKTNSTLLKIFSI
ncbi:unnamed protein product [Phyllotreta striolata]|uniref:Uncharacterized protein n=1 Tax=Phyllotreta striolata TaxID=444603 RepID=A0A9N9XLY5_PHYSR|nr:unnamed protein product [Phyllotreta striolata]